MGIPQGKEDEDLSLIDSFKVLFKASKAYWLINLVNFADGIAYFGILTLLTLYLGTQGLGLPDRPVGLTVSSFTGLVTLFMIGGGSLGDALGVRRALTLSLVVLTAGRALLSSAIYFKTGGAESLLAPQNFVAWLGLLLMAMGTGVLQPALYAGIKEFTDPRTATIGFGVLYAIMNLGIVAENWLSPFIRTDGTFNLLLFWVPVKGINLGIGGVFWFCVAISAAMLLIHWLFFTKRVEAECRVVQQTEEDAKKEAARTWAQRILDLPINDARFMYFIFVLLPVRTLFAHQWLTLPDYVFRCYPKEVADRFEWLNAINPAVIVIFVPLIAGLTRKVSVVTMMIIGTTVSALTTFILVPGATSIWALIVYITVFSFGEALWSSRFLEYVANIAPPGKVGAYMGLANLPWFLAKFTTGFYSGAMLAHFVPKVGPADEALQMMGQATFGSVCVPGTGASLGQPFATFYSGYIVPAMGMHAANSLWLIYGIIACVSPIGLLVARRWLMTRPDKPH